MDAERIRSVLRASVSRLSPARWSANKDADELEVQAVFPLFEEADETFFAALFSFPPEPACHFAPFVASPRPAPGLRPFEAGKGIYLAEAELNPRFVRFAVEAMRGGASSGGTGPVLHWTGKDIPPGRTGLPERLGGDTTNAVASFTIGNKKAVLKSYRTPDLFNPEPEILAFLSEKGSKVSPRVLGTVTLAETAGAKPGGGRSLYLAVLLEFAGGVPAFPAFVGNARRSIFCNLPPHDCIPARLGIAIGDLHHLLATRGAPPDIRPEAISAGDIDRWRSAMRARFEDALRALDADRASRLVRSRDAFEALLAGMNGWAGARKIRTHQDLHLGQVLISRGGFRLLDYEGEPLRKGPERIEKLPPERDVATLLRSFSYAAAVALKELKAGHAHEDERAQRWEHDTASSFIEGYLSACPRSVRKRGKKRLLPALRVWMAEKALYEIAYEAKFRPDWVGIPLEGLLGILNDPFSRQPDASEADQR